MTRKIFVLVNASERAISDGNGKPALLSSDKGSVLDDCGTGEHVSVASADFESLGIDVSGLDTGTCKVHYFRRRAHARKAKRSIEASGEFPQAELRIVELGEFDRNLKPVSSWKIEARVSKRTTYVPSDGDWFTLTTGKSTRAAARKHVAFHKSDVARALTTNKAATQYDFRIVPVYA